MLYENLHDGSTRERLGNHLCTQVADVKIVNLPGYSFDNNTRNTNIRNKS